MGGYGIAWSVNHIGGGMELGVSMAMDFDDIHVDDMPEQSTGIWTKKRTWTIGHYTTC